MAELRTEEGLRVIDLEEVNGDPEAVLEEDDGREQFDSNGYDDLETLRDEFVDAFNARDLDAVLAIVRRDVECPDIPGADGAEALAEELEAIWERSPAAILTRAFLAETPAAVAWLPDEDGRWTRAALVCFDSDDGLLSLISLPDDTDALDRAEAEEPTGEEIEEWQDWAEWDRGEETIPRSRT